MSGRHLLFPLLSLLVSGVVCDIAEDLFVIQTSYGPIRGYNFSSPWTGQPVYAFRGIRYAAPPIGNLRFKAPVAPANWTAVVDCYTDGYSCHQSIYFQDSPPYNTSEDCLFLNVYTPQLPSSIPKRLPVLVWIHGGAYIQGSGNLNEFGPYSLLDQGIVVVTLNYRLGALGFLSLGTEDVPGNAGLRDQLFALKWVQSNIERFGGDPSQVTIAGESAGSASVHMHYLSPLSKGLFRAVIAESGTCFAPWAVRDNAPGYALLLADMLNCSVTNFTLTAECLTGDNITAETITDFQTSVVPTSEDTDRRSTLVFIPVVDDYLSDSMIPALPADLIRNKSGSSVPIIMGINRDEGVISISSLNDSFSTLKTFIPWEVRNRSSAETVAALTQDLADFYFNNSSSFTINGIVDIGTDYMFTNPLVKSARLYKDRADVYLYYFTFDGNFKKASDFAKENLYNRSFVSHAQELNYIFLTGSVNYTTSLSSLDSWTTVKRMGRMWGNFVKTMTPTNGTDSLLEDISWHKVDGVTRYLHIDTDLTMVDEEFLAVRTALWDSIETAGQTSGAASWQSASSFLLLAVGLLTTFT